MDATKKLIDSVNSLPGKIFDNKKAATTKKVF